MSQWKNDEYRGGFVNSVTGQFVPYGLKGAVVPLEEVDDLAKAVRNAQYDARAYDSRYINLLENGGLQQVDSQRVQQQQQNAYNNAYLAALNNYRPVAPAARPRPDDEFTWLRRRVEEVCWRS